MQVAARKKFFGKDTGASSAAVLPPEGRFSDLSLNRDERSDVYRVRSTLFFGRPSVGVQAGHKHEQLGWQIGRMGRDLWRGCRFRERVVRCNLLVDGENWTCR